MSVSSSLVHRLDLSHSPQPMVGVGCLELVRKPLSFEIKSHRIFVAFCQGLGKNIERT